MKRLISLAISLSIATILCNATGRDGYVKYQTFNEYKLRGEGTKNIVSPYVYVKKTKNTISVIRSNRMKEVIEYVNKGDHWYRYIEIKHEPHKKNCKCLIYTEIREQFVFNDTVVEYSYTFENHDKKRERGNEYIYIRTSDREIHVPVYLKIKNTKDPYKSVKYIVDNYKKVLKPYTSRCYLPKRYYSLYRKEIKNGVFYKYEIADGKETLVDEINLYGLDEFVYFEDTRRQ